MIDYHVHAVAHGEFAYTREWVGQFIECASQNGINEIGFCEHNEFIDSVDFKLFKDMQTERKQDITLKFGVELDYFPGSEADLIKFVQALDYDYVIGSVHFIDGWGFDHPDFKGGFEERDIDDIYGQYADILMQMVASNCCDIVGHIDLVKVWGHRPRRKRVLSYLDPVLKAVKYYDLAVEINSGGLRKPVEELYPSLEIIERMYEYNIPIVLGSDAHHPDQMGYGLAEAYRSARLAGYERCIIFNHREKSVVRLQY